MNCTPHSPSPRYQMNAAVITNRKARTNAVAQGDTAILGK